jgi:hypothetical protein
MRVKPNTGLQVRDPVTKGLVPEDGIEVSEYDIYWAARLRDKDVVVVNEEASKTKARSATQTE